MASDLERPSLGGPVFRAARPGRGGPDGVEAGVLAALAAAPMPMVLSDPNRPDNPIAFANPAFLRMTGYDRSEVIGRNCRFLQGPGSDPRAIDAVRRAIDARDEVAVELLNYRRDGTEFWNALFVAPVFDAAGGLLYFFAAQRDLSRRGGDERGRRRPAGGSHRAVDDVAHDLNNMLQIVAGHAEGMQKHAAASDDARLLRRLRAVSEAADRATALARELVEASRGPEHGSTRGPAPDPDGPVAAPARGDGRRDGATGAGAVDPEARVEARAEGRERGGERVLVVDDRTEVAELARTMLEAAGYAVEVATGGQDALNKLRRGFDLLFSDLVMPGDIDGLSLAREAQRRDPRLKVLLTTGQAGPAGTRAGGEGGFETIGKPYRRSELVRTVRRLLDPPAASA